MTENNDEIIDRLLTENEQFQSLHRKHADLKSRVNNVVKGLELMNDFELSTVKKKKLHLKDQMAIIIEQYRHEHNEHEHQR